MTIEIDLAQPGFHVQVLTGLVSIVDLARAYIHLFVAAFAALVANAFPLVLVHFLPYRSPRSLHLIPFRVQISDFVKPAGRLLRYERRT
jgi:hypothetical protein